MKQSLSLGQQQRLAMTPRMRQAIRLQQLSALELGREIQEALESNPMLEEDGDDGDDFPARSLEETGDGNDLEGAAEEPAVDIELTRPIPEELPVDSNWDDIFQPSAAASIAGDARRDPEPNDSAAQTLSDHLHWQLNLASMSDTDRLIALAIIDAVNADGRLEASEADLLSAFDPRLEIGKEEVRAVLKRIQRFDPPGVAARNLSECLALQLEALHPSTKGRDAAMLIVTSHLDLFAANDSAAVQRKTGLAQAELSTAAALIQSLHPRPGAALATEPAQYVIPDVVARREKRRWVVELNPEATPALRLNKGYAALVKRGGQSPQNTWLRENLQEARWFLKCLENRHDTLLRVATKIVELQRGFLERGVQAMRPLVLSDVAEAVDLHDSTISRVVSGKTMQTPRGLFDLRYFFSSQIAAADGSQVSSTAVRALIKQLTDKENPRKPLSDNKIAAILAQRNINVARRTVAKYRESMSIPPSSGRKRLEPTSAASQPQRRQPCS